MKTKICGNLEVFDAPVSQKFYEKIMGNNPSKIKGKKFPVTNVSAYDVEEFCNKLGEGWRLPTDEEWTFLAGYKTYSGSDNIDDVAVYNRNSICKRKTKQPNEFGLYDMSGLVWEWTSTSISRNLVIRGGSWNDVAEYCTVSYVDNLWPAGRGFVLGFRPVRTIK